MTDPLAQLKERVAAVWGLGDYARVAELILPASQALVDACAISAGQEVLDVAAGSGNLAVLAAREGASVVASDISPGQVELGRARTEAEGLAVEWVVADVEDLPFEDERFDCCASVFGAMFGPRPDVTARELFRVVRPGGTVGLAVWGPYGLQHEVFCVTQRYAPPLPDGVPGPREWGREEVARERLEGLAARIELERHTMHWEFPSLEAMFHTYAGAGPQAAMQESMTPEQRDEIRAEVTEIVQRYNQGEGGSIVVEPEYLQVVARKRG